MLCGCADQRLLAKACEKAARPPPRPSTPDADNIAKAVCDALETAGVLENDRFVTELNVRTLYTSKDDAPGVWVTVTPLEVD